MNKTLKKMLKAAFWYLMFDGLILGYVGLIPGLQMAGAQTILTTTTLASAVTSSSTTQIQLTSNSGLTAGGSIIFVADTANSGEAMFVNSVSTSGGYIGVTRGYQTLGGGVTHASGALVFLGPPQAFFYQPPRGSCTRSTVLYLPAISFGTASNPSAISDCIGGVWVNGSGIGSASTFFRQVILDQDCGGTTYATPCGANTTLAANTMYCSEADIGFSKYATGLGILNGATATTDKHWVALYDGTGNLVAQSATAGVVAATGNAYQLYAFTTPYYIVGPAKYYTCADTNGTTATLNMSQTGQLDQMTTKSYSSTTFTSGPPATITVPTTYTTAVGPLFEVY